MFDRCPAASSASDKSFEQIVTERDSPPLSSIITNDEPFSPTSPSNQYIPHHQRNHSLSSTSSGGNLGNLIMNSKRDVVPMLGTSVPTADSADSAYGGSSNHLYAEIGKPFFSSVPSVSV